MGYELGKMHSEQPADYVVDDGGMRTNKNQKSLMGGSALASKSGNPSAPY